MIELHSLNTFRGGAKIIVNEDNIGDRVDLAKKIEKLIRDGNSVFLCSKRDGNKFTAGDRIQGYDSKTNEWILARARKAKKQKAKRVLAKGTHVVTSAPSAGG